MKLYVIVIVKGTFVGILKDVGKRTLSDPGKYNGEQEKCSMNHEENCLLYKDWLNVALTRSDIHYNQSD